MSKTKLIQAIELNAKNGNVEIETDFNTWYVDFHLNIQKDYFFGYIYRISKKTENNKEKIFDNRNIFFEALTNVLENQNVRVITENN
jgi:hypothetical protein